MSNTYLTPTYDIYISGKKLSVAKKSYISSVRLKETVVESDSATIEINDPDYEFLEDDLFLNDNRIKVTVGFLEDTYRVNFNGYISDINVKFPEDGCPVLTATCMDRTHVMNRKKKSRTFSKTTNAEVVKKIVASYGLKCVIDPDYKFTVQDSISQSKQTDINFIQSLASNEVYPFTARLVGDTFYYVKKGKLGKAVKNLHYKEYPYDIISMEFSIDKESKQVEVSSAKVDSDTKKVSSSSSKTDNKETTNVTEDVKKKNNSTKEVTYKPETGNWYKK